jgi:hypothetical protein
VYGLFNGLALPAGHWAERTDSRKNLFKRGKKPANDDTFAQGANLDKYYPRHKESLDVGKGTCTPPRQVQRPRYKKQTAKKLTRLPQGLGKQHCYSLGAGGSEKAARAGREVTAASAAAKH